MEINGLEELRNKAAKMQKELNKTMDFQMNKLQDVLKKIEVKKEKRGKFNKKSCTMQLCSDGNMKVIFDDPNDVNKFFE